MLKRLGAHGGCRIKQAESGPCTGELKTIGVSDLQKAVAGGPGDTVVPSIGERAGNAAQSAGDSIGNAFKNKTDTIERTELVIFIRPKVVRNVSEARSVNDEFRKRLDFGASETPGNRIKRDLKRLQ